jgi:hypothetical protein
MCDDVVVVAMSVLVRAGADEPPGAPVTPPTDGAPAAASLLCCVLAPKTEPDNSELSWSPVTQTGVPSDFFAHTSSPRIVCPVIVLLALNVEK